MTAGMALTLACARRTVEGVLLVGEAIVVLGLVRLIPRLCLVLIQADESAPSAQSGHVFDVIGSFLHNC